MKKSGQDKESNGSVLGYLTAVHVTFRQLSWALLHVGGIIVETRSRRVCASGSPVDAMLCKLDSNCGPSKSAAHYQLDNKALLQSWQHINKWTNGQTKDYHLLCPNLLIHRELSAPAEH